ncbi:hypothetical protein I4U23_021576 [Adineta vaga]|nr:hypothetical protein I4U23_021576 [Adineta vaga]
MPKLRRVKIFGSYFSFLDQTIFNNLTFLLPDLRFLKLKLSNAHFISNCFKELHSTMPCLKHFDLYYEKHILPELFVNFFTLSWWPILEQISYIHIDIKENNRKILYERANRLNGIMKVKWTQTDYSKLRRIEILINKFI